MVADLAFISIAVEIACRHQDAGDQQRGIDQGELAFPHAPAGPHVEEVIVETPVAGRIRRLALDAVYKEAQHLEGPLRRLLARKPAVFHRDRIGGKGKADDGDAAGRTVAGGVGYEAGVRVRIVDQIGEGRALKPADQRLVRKVPQAHRACPEGE